MSPDETEDLGNWLISLDLTKAAFISKPTISIWFPEFTSLSSHGAKSMQVCSYSSEDACLHPWGRAMLGFHMSTKWTTLISLGSNCIIFIPLFLTPEQHSVVCTSFWILLHYKVSSRRTGDAVVICYLFTLRGRALWLWYRSFKASLWSSFREERVSWVTCKGTAGFQRQCMVITGQRDYGYGLWLLVSMSVVKEVCVSVRAK